MLKAWKIWRRRVCKFVYICITGGKSYHFSAKILSKVVTFSSRNTNVYKFANFARPYNMADLALVKIDYHSSF